MHLRQLRACLVAMAATLGILGIQGVANADVLIDTTPSWNGSSGVSPFGYPNTATYGQTVTAPGGTSFLESFSFFLNTPAATTFQAEVYAWDNVNSQATGPNLFESGLLSTAGAGFEQVTINTGGTPVTPGDLYVLFFSVSNLRGVGSGPWGYTGADPYVDGQFVFLNNGNDATQWTTAPWSTFGAADLAFTADFGTTGAPAAPEPSSIALLGMGLGGLFVVARRKKRGA